MEKNWKGLPFRPISERYRERFGEKVYKIPLAIAEDCPNRQGLKGMTTCIFCDVWGSAARAEALDMELTAQLTRFKEVIRKRFKARQYLAYFQAYTTTFTQLVRLKKHFSMVLEDPEIRGIVLGTRPDFLSQGIFDLWKETAEQTYLGIEFGVQSFFDSQLEFLRRGHTRQQSIQAILRAHEESAAEVGIHLIFGLPDETDEQIRETAQIINDLPVSNVKLHNLHVLTNTPLAEMYHNGQFLPLEFKAYADRVALFLEHLSPRIFVHRLAAYAPRWDELVAPAWTNDKMKTHQGIIDRIRQKGSFQSRHFVATDENEARLRTQLLDLSQPRLSASV